MLLVLNAAEAQVDILLGPPPPASPDGAPLPPLTASRSFDTPTRGTEVLAPALQALLREQGCRVANLTHMACVVGPGSFTGIRLTLTTAAALRRVYPLQVGGCNFLHCIAVMGARLHPAAPQYWVITHARRNLVHVQAFQPAPAASGLPEPCTAVELLSPDDAIARLAQAPQGAVALGSGLERNPCIAAQHPHLTLHSQTQPEAVDLWRCAQGACYAHQDLAPVYVRPCDAIDNLNHIAAKQGMAPEYAHARLRDFMTAPVQEAQE